MKFMDAVKWDIRSVGVSEEDAEDWKVRRRQMIGRDAPQEGTG